MIIDRLRINMSYMYDHSVTNKPVVVRKRKNPKKQQNIFKIEKV